MKKYLSYAIALAAVVTVACNKENPSVDQPDKGNTGLRSFTAYVDGAATRTVFGNSENGQRTSLWKGTESIKVLSKGQEAVTFKTANLESETKAAEFKIAEGSTLAAGPWFAVYPHAANPSWTEETTVVTGLVLNPQQTAVAGGYDPANHFAIAYTDDATLNFKNLVSFIKVTIEVDGVSEVCIFGNNNEKLAGDFTADWNKGNPKVIVSEGSLTYAKITGTLTKGSVYYIACLPCTFENGFTLEAVINDTKFQKKSDKKHILSRNKVLDLGEVSVWRPSIHSTAGGTWETKAMKRVENGIYMTTLNSTAEFEFKVKFINQYKNEDFVWARPVSNDIKTTDGSANVGKWYNIYIGDGNSKVPAGDYDVYVDVHNGAVCFVQENGQRPTFDYENRALHILCQDTNWESMHRWNTYNGSFNTTWETTVPKNNDKVWLLKDGKNKDFIYWVMPQDLNGTKFNFCYKGSGSSGDFLDISLTDDLFTYANNGYHGTYSLGPVKY